MENQNTNDPASKVDVRIVGPLKLQNELMAWFLSQTTGLSCLCRKVPNRLQAALWAAKNLQISNPKGLET